MTRNEFKAGAVQVCGLLLTTYYACLIANLINTAALWGRFLGVGASVATLYGIKSAYDHQKERVAWTDDQKRAASLQFIASGKAPIQGFEHLLVDPTLVLPPGTPAPLPPLLDPTAASSSAVTAAAKAVVVGSATSEKEGPK